MTVGIYRDREGLAHVQQGNDLISMSQLLYEAHGYKPRFEDLPTKGMFEKWQRQTGFTSLSFDIPHNTP
ncbi:hypothetical protein BH10PSE7_BH10PSE7_05110 [soil metagenome]